ncbi:MAG: class I SAM-dependent methyltransferase, partial [Gammaproteobacteria bacterium PRO8]|nr:class I SAM-dependent methyltransferase [Gammaproteobacteria bacterium PRO8]
MRGLGNITWITASILDLPQLGLGRFDYIECCGVLHHLESTEAGLAALNTALADDGAIFLMLYGRYGRRAVYDMQQLLRELLPPGLPIPEKIRLTRQLLATLPATNGFARDYEQWRSEIEAGGLGDAGLYDLLLHSQDRCFDVPQLYQLAAGAGLQLLSFAHRADAYDPRNHIGDAELSSLIAGRDLASRQALAEQLVGNLRKHEFFLARQAGRGATLADAGLALRSFGTLYDNA